MNKRIWAVLLVVVMAISMVPMTAMAAECTHANKTTLAHEDATCGMNGYTIWKCNDCASTGNDVHTATGNHNYVNGTCTVCGAWTTQPCAHNYQTVKEQAATCTEPAYVWEKCTLCGNEKNGEVGSVDPNAHNYVVVKEQAATCTEPAYVWEKCTRCGNEKNGEVGAVDPTAHNYEVVKELLATCLEPAYVWEKCSHCGNEKNGEVGAADPNAHNYVDGKCTICGNELNCEHAETYVDIFEANCVKEGYKKTYCKACNTLIKEEVLAKNNSHAFVNGVCVLCGASENPADPVEPAAPAQVASTAGLDNVPKTGCAFVEWLYALIFG